MNRRSFITSLLTGIVAPAFLPGANRQWKRSGELWMPYRRAFEPDEWFMTQIDMRSLAFPDTSLLSFLIAMDRQQPKLPNPNWKPADPVNDNSWSSFNWTPKI